MFIPLYPRLVNLSPIVQISLLSLSEKFKLTKVGKQETLSVHLNSLCCDKDLSRVADNRWIMICCGELMTW